MTLSQTIPVRLANLARDIDLQIEAVTADAKRQDIAVEEMKYADGKYVLTDLLLAKSNVFLALTNYTLVGQNNA